MASIATKHLKLIVKEYDKGKSAREIALKLNVGIDAVYYFMRNNNIPRRNTVDRNRVRFERKAPSFKLKKKLSADDELLKSLSVAIYWAEGYKSKKAVCVDLANSDAAMIRLFMKFLRDVCGIDETRLRILLYCHDKQLIPELIAYWSSVTGISPKLFTKPYIPKRSSSTNHRTMSQGLIHIRYYDKKLLQRILSWIEEYKQIA